MTEEKDIIQEWVKYCDANGILKEGQAVRLGLQYFDYKLMIQGHRQFPAEVIKRMMGIIQFRNTVDQTVLKTRLLKDFEDSIQKCLQGKAMFTLVAPTGQGKTIAARYLANQYGCKYYNVLSELQRKNHAAQKNFIRDLANAYGFNEKSTNNERNLINKLQSDTRSVLIIDECQRLISDDWGYFKVLQDLHDNCSNLSIILLGNFGFYEHIKVAPERTYEGTLDEDDVIRTVSYNYFFLLHMV